MQVLFVDSRGREIPVAIYPNGVPDGDLLKAHLAAAREKGLEVDRYKLVPLPTLRVGDVLYVPSPNGYAVPIALRVVRKPLLLL